MLERVAHELGMKDSETLLAQVGYGKLTSREVLQRVAPDADLDSDKAAGPLKRILRTVTRKAPAAGVRVSSLPDVLVRFARCCDPLPGERIAGFVTRGRGVTVHATGCARVLEADPLRRVDCVWDSEASEPRPVRLEVTCVDATGQLATISKAIAGASVFIRKAESKALADDKASMTFEVMVRDIEELSRLIRNLMRLKGVMSVERLRG